MRGPLSGSWFHPSHAQSTHLPLFRQKKGSDWTLQIESCGSTNGPVGGQEFSLLQRKKGSRSLTQPPQTQAQHPQSQLSRIEMHIKMQN